jgi:phenylpyruvate tautomerase PptA (4-oxalocrotonate tautomerase family)
MPLAKIEVRKSRPPEQVQAIIEAVYQAQREALKLPERDRTIRYIEHRPEHFHAPPDKDENYSLVEITLYAGRSLDAKRALYQGIVKRFEFLGIPASDIVIVLNEVPLDNWGVRGGHPASEVDLGFKVNV